MDGTALPDELAAIAAQHALDLDEDAPEPVRGRRVVRAVDGVLVEPNRRLNLDRHRPNLHRERHLAEHAHDVAVEVGDRSRRERQRSCRSIRRSNRQLVVDEVELDHERAPAMRQRPRGKTTRGDLQRDRPRMIDRRRLRERDLPDHLRPHVERRVGVLPSVVRQSRPWFVVHERHDTLRPHARHLPAHRCDRRRQTSSSQSLRGVHQDRWTVGASPHMSELRCNAMLRLVAEPSREQTRTRQRPSGDRVGRTWGAVAVLLRG